MDLLTPCAIFSKSMQANELDILGALTNVLRAMKDINMLNAKPLDQWPTSTSTLQKIVDKDGEWVYKGQVLQRFLEGKLF